MTSWRRGALAISLVHGALSVHSRDAAAQDTTWREGVRISGAYARRTGKPGLLVLPVTSAEGDSLRRIFSRDFTHGDRIAVIDMPAASVPPANPNGTLNYPLFAQLGADLLLQVSPTSFGIQVVVHSVGDRKVERSQSFPLPQPAYSADWRLALHTIADDVEEMVTGERGISATRILYVSQGRVWQIDADGANPTALTGDVRAYSPTWHPAGAHIAYTSITATGARVVIRESGGATRALSTGSGLAQSPVFSRDGNTLVYSSGNDAGTDLVAVNPFASEPPRRISIGRGSDNMSPTFSRDGRRIAYTTNRLGRIDIYLSDSDGTNAEALMPFMEPAYRSDPDWSPDGRLIAFQMQFGGNFQVMTMNVRDRTVKQVTSDGVNENASFAPDSRHVVFTSTRSGVPQLWVMDLVSGTARQLTYGNARARHAAWSPSLRYARRP